MGVNKFQVDEEEPPGILRIDPEREKRQVRRLAEFRRARTHQKVSDSLRRLEDAAGSPEDLMPAVLDAVECRATLGEIAVALRNVFGVYREQVAV